ncbi:synaptonemal complex protein, putative [Entamoeba dispar SAW760]|uniref:Synaptonemal complex protein, putative n=1 Tax=Entamoeba dispar (strain ATCC PRA-260 / SAW760) TaxID=370354 RepID=B0ED53_ENTDS|nr:synaptonemal complex protein, putative [Entamoeba dispar SAW760]EDR27470.1 synaptonemal complex protein, putative [Entamoeba dispar SAW760]|eukprot:EDR27470.1 synaptonemal complex protein, putative [Entamoeba dispar SAW760]
MDRELRQQNLALLKLLLQVTNVTSKASGEFYCLTKTSNECVRDLVQQKYNINENNLIHLKTIFQHCNESLIQKIKEMAPKLLINEFELMLNAIKQNNEDEGCGYYIQTHMEETSLKESQFACIYKVFHEEFSIDLKDYIIEIEKDRSQYEEIIEEKEQKIKELEEEIYIALDNNYDMEQKLKEQEEIIKRYQNYCFDKHGNQKEFKTRDNETLKMNTIKSLNNQIFQLQKSIEEKEIEIVKLNNQIQNKEEKVEYELDNNNENNLNIKNLNIRIQELENQCNLYNKQINELNEELKKKLLTLDNKEKELIEKEIELETKLREIEIKDMQIGELENKLNEKIEEEQNDTTLQVLIEEINLQIQEKEQHLNILKESINKKQEEILQLKEDLVKKDNELKTVMEELNKQRILLETKINNEINKEHQKNEKIQTETDKKTPSQKFIPIKIVSKDEHITITPKISLKDKIKKFEQLPNSESSPSKKELKIQYTKKYSFVSIPKPLPNYTQYQQTQPKRLSNMTVQEKIAMFNQK